jgi:hypothetical protein
VEAFAGEFFCAWEKTFHLLRGFAREISQGIIQHVIVKIIAKSY